MSNLGAAIGIPCYFKPKSESSNLSQNNMGSLWEPLNWTLVGHHNINFFIAQDPYEDNLKRKSILFAGLLKLKFRLLGRSTIRGAILPFCHFLLGSDLQKVWVGLDRAGKFKLYVSNVSLDMYEKGVFPSKYTFSMRVPPRISI